ncbi:MAG: UDP-N-acetylmuramate--L-alanine ligase [Prevotellaceae bacterium]|nr:UDP-N-acetylmuramate--L-alanine ligase [Prevotellaceae bacterium]
MNNVYFIGIGGIGMSALARYFLHEQKVVAGYDRTSTPLTQELEREGAAIHYEDSEANIPRLVLDNLAQSLVIYTPAVGDDNSELRCLHRRGAKIVKRSEALGVVANGKTLLAVSGTHGKTTTSTQLAHIITSAGKGCSAFLGGISKNYNTNLLLAQSELMVAEADEYDRSFLRLFPNVAVVTSADADHLDIYGSHDELRRSFGEFVCQIRKGGALVLKKSLEKNGKPSFAPHYGERLYTYSYDEPSDFYAFNIRELAGGYFRFDLYLDGTVERDCTLGVPGWVNVENAVAASAAAYLVGVAPAQISAALKTFAGVRRRFDVQVRRPDFAYIDDYAHHPAELSAAITSIRNMYPERRITGVFQPHLYTRTRDFADDFALSLALLDELILLPIYPAREEPIAGVSSALIFDKLKLKSKVMCEKSELVDLIRSKASSLQVLVTLGAGDIDTLVEPIKNLTMNS